MKDIVRGVSIHSSGDGLKYYVHYDGKGTLEVRSSEYERAVRKLKSWEKKVKRESPEKKMMNAVFKEEKRG